MNKIEKQVAQCLKYINDFLNDYKLLNDAEFQHKYSTIKEDAINDKVKDVHNNVNKYLK